MQLTDPISVPSLLASAKPMPTGSGCQSSLRQDIVVFTIRLRYSNHVTRSISVVIVKIKFNKDEKGLEKEFCLFRSSLICIDSSRRSMESRETERERYAFIL